MRDGILIEVFCCAVSDLKLTANRQYYMLEWARSHLAPTPILQYHMDIDGVRRHNT